ncbi:MAG: Ig-like domain-containing protein [Anaerolineales bacterium]|nr:Ig-like domain-containing protein [Anaerolineales bacterium]
MILFAAAGVWWGIQPRLLNVEPPPHATAVPGSASVRLTFSHFMQPESVLQRLQIQPLPLGNFHWEDKTLIFTPMQPWQSGATVQVRLRNGALTRSFPQTRLRRDFVWSFQIGYPKVLYLFPYDGTAGLYILDPLTMTVQLLTETGQEVYDYSLSANGAIVLFSARESNGSAIYRWEGRQGVSERLLSFANGQVRAAQLSPSGKYLAYELTDLSEANAKTHVWVTHYPVQEGSAAIRLGEVDQLTRTPIWSAGNLLAYYDQAARRYRFYDPQTKGEMDFIDCETGEKGTWSPDGKAFLFAEILPSEGSFPTSHLMLYELLSRKVSDLSERNDVEDLGGVFSPQGDRLVFARKFLNALQWTPGRQLWLLDLTRNEARPLLTDAQYNHYDFAWSPNGDQILFMRFNQTSLTEPPEVWMINADGSEPRQLVKGGFAPQWIP